MLGLMFLGCCALFFATYKVYGGWMERRLDVMDERLTPAHTMRDGVDYEPGPDAVVLGRPPTVFRPTFRMVLAGLPRR